MDVVIALGIAGLMRFLSRPTWSATVDWALVFALGLAWAFFGAQSPAAIGILLVAGLLTAGKDRASLERTIRSSGRLLGGLKRSLRTGRNPMSPQEVAPRTGKTVLPDGDRQR